MVDLLNAQHRNYCAGGWNICSAEKEMRTEIPIELKKYNVCRAMNLIDIALTQVDFGSNTMQ